MAMYRRTGLAGACGRRVGLALVSAAALAGAGAPAAWGQANFPPSALAIASGIVGKKDFTLGPCYTVFEDSTRQVGGLGADSVSTGPVNVANTDCDGYTGSASAASRAERRAGLLGVFANATGDQPDAVPNAFAAAQINDDVTVQVVQPAEGEKRAVMIVHFADESDRGPAIPSCAEALPGACRNVHLDIDTISTYDERAHLTTASLRVELKPLGDRKVRKFFVPVRAGTEPDTVSVSLTLTAAIVDQVGAVGAIVGLNLELPDEVIRQILESPAEGSAPRAALGTANPDFVIRPGQAVRAPQGSLTISPGSGVLVPGQAFDLVLVAQTTGQAITGTTATLDGSDVSPILEGCTAGHTGILTLATPGEVRRCPGLSGSLFAPGVHTFTVTMTLAGGGTLTDTVEWEVPGSSPPPVDPVLTVSPPPGILTENQAFDVVLLLDAPGRDVLFGQVIFDSLDVTFPVAACIVPQPLPTGQLALRCPGLTGQALGRGVHIVEVLLFLSGGFVVEGGAVWQVLAAS